MGVNRHEIAGQATLNVNLILLKISVLVHFVFSYFANKT